MNPLLLTHGLTRSSKPSRSHRVKSSRWRAAETWQRCSRACVQCPASETAGWLANGCLARCAIVFRPVARVWHGLFDSHSRFALRQDWMKTPSIGSTSSTISCRSQGLERTAPSLSVVRGSPMPWPTTRRHHQYCTSQRSVHNGSGRNETARGTPVAGPRGRKRSLGHFFLPHGKPSDRTRPITFAARWSFWSFRLVPSFFSALYKCSSIVPVL